MTPEFTAAQLAEARQLLEDVRADLQNHALLPTWQRKICAFLSYAPAQPKLDYDTAIELIRAGCGACLADAKPYWHPTGTPCPTPSPETGTAAVPACLNCDHTEAQHANSGCFGLAPHSRKKCGCGAFHAVDPGPAPEPVKSPATWIDMKRGWVCTQGPHFGQDVPAAKALPFGDGDMSEGGAGACIDCWNAGLREPLPEQVAARTPAAGIAPTEACVQQCFSWGCRSSCARRDKHTADEFHGCLDHGGIREGSST